MPDSDHVSIYASLILVSVMVTRRTEKYRNQDQEHKGHKANASHSLASSK